MCARHYTGGRGEFKTQKQAQIPPAGAYFLCLGTCQPLAVVLPPHPEVEETASPLGSEPVLRSLLAGATLSSPTTQALYGVTLSIPDTCFIPAQPAPRALTNLPKP